MKPIEVRVTQGDVVSIMDNLYKTPYGNFSVVLRVGPRGLNEIPALFAFVVRRAERVGGCDGTS